MPELSLLGLERLARAELIPFAGALELTHRCNLSCSHCYMKGLSEADAGTPALLRLLDDLATAGTLEVELTGGEPMLHKDFFRVVDRARELNMALTLITNGTLIDSRAARRIAEAQLLQVEVTLNGMTAHDSMAGVAGAHRLAMQAVELLRQERVRVVVKFLVTRQNLHELDEVASFSQSVGAVFAPSPLVAPNVAGISLPDAARLSREELLTYYVSRTSGDLPEPYVCGAGLSSFAISPEGKVLPCQLWRQEAGDLHRSSFDEIWRESPLFIWIRRLSANEQVSCAGCSNRSFCTPCPGMAYTESGNALLPNLYSCECARAHQEVFENGRKEAVRKARAHEA